MKMSNNTGKVFMFFPIAIKSHPPEITIVIIITIVNNVGWIHSIP